MTRGAGVQAQVESYQRHKKWYLTPPCLTLSIIRYVSRGKWRNPGEGVVPSATPQCRSYWKGRVRVSLDYCRQLTFYLRNKIYLYTDGKLNYTKLKHPSLCELFWYPSPDDGYWNRNVNVDLLSYYIHLFGLYFFCYLHETYMFQTKQDEPPLMAVNGDMYRMVCLQMFIIRGI